MQSHFLEWEMRSRQQAILDEVAAQRRLHTVFNGLRASLRLAPAGMLALVAAVHAAPDEAATRFIAKGYF